MGVFGWYLGNGSIPENKRKQFSDYMGKVLNYGGMMEPDPVRLYGKEIILLDPVKVRSGGSVYFSYNYFEDDRWETAEYDDENLALSTEKIGSSEFSDVIMAAYMLQEYFCDDYGLAVLNGRILNSTRYVAWLNNLLGTEFSMAQRSHLWDIAEEYAMLYLKSGEDDSVFPEKTLWEIIPWSLVHVSGGTELADLLFITGGTEKLEYGSILPGSYPDDIRKAKCFLKAFFEELVSEDPEEELWEMLRMDREKRAGLGNTALADVAGLSLILPARVFVYLSAEIRHFRFWETWSNLKDHVYHDEKMKMYASPDVESEREREWNEPVTPMSTSMFLKQGGSFRFMDTPEELRRKPDYYISDDDRLYWWDGSDEVRISEKTDKWLKKLAGRHKEIIGEGTEERSGNDFLEKFIFLLDDVNKYYKRIFAFSSMFYDFLQNSQSKEYQAALELFSELAEENRKEGEVIQYVSYDWETSNRNVTHNIARLRLKRYLSVMANIELRKLYFGF